MIRTISLRTDKWRIWALVPLLALAVDFYLYPFLLHTNSHGQVPPLKQFIGTKSAYLGRYRGHEIYASVGTLANADYVKNLVSNRTQGVTVVMSHFIAQKGFTTIFGPVGRAIYSGFQKVSPESADRFRKFLKDTADIPPGHVREFSIRNNHQAPHEAFPVESVLAVMLNSTETQKSYIKNITTGLTEALKRASDLQTYSLLMTTLALGPRHKLVQPFKFFETMFSAMPLGLYPRQIIVGFFGNWPNDYMKENINGLNEAWKSQTQSPISDRIFKPIFRLTLLSLSICLIVSSFAARLSLKNTLLISIAYLSLVVGATQVLTFLLSSYGPDVLLGGSIAFQLILALFFPYIVLQNPRGVFGKE